jgi:hypothetical protein
MTPVVAVLVLVYDSLSPATCQPFNPASDTAELPVIL